MPHTCTVTKHIIFIFFLYFVSHHCWGSVQTFKSNKTVWFLFHFPGGDVFSWGSNSHGQLGLGKEVALQHTPVLVCALSGVPVTQIAAGASHTLLLTLTGLVYCCGANKSGQLGLNRVDEKGTSHLPWLSHTLTQQIVHNIGQFHTCQYIHLPPADKVDKFYASAPAAASVWRHYVFGLSIRPSTRYLKNVRREFPKIW